MLCSFSPDGHLPRKDSCEATGELLVPLPAAWKVEKIKVALLESF